MSNDTRLRPLNPQTASTPPPRPFPGTSGRNPIRGGADLMKDWPDAGEAEIFPGDLMRVTTWTMLVLGVGIGGILLLKRCGLGGRFATGPGSGIRLRGTLMLAPRTGVHLVSVGPREFLVAVDPRGVGSITIVPPQFEEEDIAGEESTREPLDADGFPMPEGAERA